MKITWMRHMGEDEDYQFSTRDLSASVYQIGEDPPEWTAKVIVEGKDGMRIEFNGRGFDSCAAAKSWAAERINKADAIRNAVAAIFAL